MNTSNNILDLLSNILNYILNIFINTKLNDAKGLIIIAIIFLFIFFILYWFFDESKENKTSSKKSSSTNKSISNKTKLTRPDSTKNNDSQSSGLKETLKSNSNSSLTETKKSLSSQSSLKTKQSGTEKIKEQKSDIKNNNKSIQEKKSNTDTNHLSSIHNVKDIPIDESTFEEELKSGKINKDDKLGLIYKLAPNNPDDLTRIWGVAKILSKKLNKFGVYKFKQIASWNDNVIDEFSKHLAFKNRVRTDRWIAQCKTLHEMKYDEKI